MMNPQFEYLNNKVVEGNCYFSICETNNIEKNSFPEDEEKDVEETNANVKPWESSNTNVKKFGRLLKRRSPSLEDILVVLREVKEIKSYMDKVLNPMTKCF